MKYSKKLLEFCILSETETREPLCLLLRYIDPASEEDMRGFLEVLNKMVKDELLQCYYWSADDSKYVLLRDSFFENISDYIQAKRGSTENITMPSKDREIFEFMISEQGANWLDERYKVVEEKTVGLIEAIERFHSSEKAYPKDLYAVCPKYLDIIEQPLEVFGSWWFTLDEERSQYYLGYYTFFGQLKIYDTEIGIWKDAY